MAIPTPLQGSTPWKFFADDPITKASEDRLNRLTFADQVARVCTAVAKQSDTSVMALIAPYGSGKSSILSLVEQSLTPNSEWAVVKFNPWLFSDIDSLLHSFFVALNEAIGKRGGKALRRKLGGYALSVAPYAGIAGLAGIDPGKIAEAAGKFLQGDMSAEAQKQDLSEALRKFDRKILVTIDDLDRLQPSELLLVLKLIRLTGRLPNVYYLLAYDERTVLDVIARSDLAAGNQQRARDYMEKIVQVRLDLPPLHARRQRLLVSECISTILMQHAVTLSDTARRVLSERYEDMASYLRQPRAINRLFAQMDAVYPLVRHEVDFVDFLTLTFLRTFESKAYDNLYSQKAELVGSNNYWDFLGKPSEQAEQVKERWLKWLEEWGVSPENVGQISRLLLSLFPALESKVAQVSYGREYYRDLRATRRAGSSDYFDRYFHFGITEFDIADSVVAEAIEQIAQDVDGPARKELATALQTNPFLTLSKLGSVASGGNLPGPAPLLIFVVQTGRFLEDPNDPHRFEIQTSLRILAHLLFAQMDLAEIGPTVSRLAGIGSLEILVDFTLPRFGREQAPEWSRVAAVHAGDVLQAHFDELAKQPLSSSPEGTAYLLRMWPAFRPEEEIRNWLWLRIRSGQWELLDVLIMLVGEATLSSSGSVKRVVNVEFSEKDLERLLGVSEVLDACSDFLQEADEDLDNLDELEPSHENKKRVLRAALKRIAQSRGDGIG
ncbi:KAP family P-loop NTPase fold protein [Micromonospora tulbaghiae]|uniref:KAP family P-loop NTPase fold protein n=1 Tax=Micromonospora tulbaghiae TaxID=479978 RepID=UPI00340EAFAE